MRGLTRIITQIKRESRLDNQQLFNIIREYIQVLILKAIYQSSYGKGLSFIGGTCLRICYGLKRFSEDLDFNLDKKIKGYSFANLNALIVRFLKNSDFEADVNVSEDKVVQKSFIRVSEVLHLFGITPLKGQKLHVKLEVDTRPVKLGIEELESFFVAKFDETFPILKHTEETLFGGKIAAILNRPYTKGRDFYDLMWYLRRKTALNLRYLNKICQQAGLKIQFKNKEDVFDVLGTRVRLIPANEILKDIKQFLEDPTEDLWLKDYQAAFKQAVKQYLELGKSIHKI